ncbi:type I secretion system permease/ATPase [Accumulibacter sp.]|uniref:Cyclolysin secretion/processing ATP-binding protein CyaB n=1 Tax=Candidatus Accumulibacter proximus TaxID=2954385 RepID=A0A935Q1D3_9PROT|nr:type I secretion system permease/ATPase [Accumulibacter sp.]MBK7675195.1 type I secretion system permease/ATPase [Candidatus Accumulibacter proximus]MBL8374551.1 type I secretion system permease/ATPase [Accumulibacter sp.]
MTSADTSPNRPASAQQPDFAEGLREDLLHNDPLLDCLVELTRLHGRPSTRAALSAGLPLAGGCLSPSLFARAATRAGLSSRIVRRQLADIDSALLPVILLLKGDGACVLLGWNDGGETARLLFPETGQGEVLLEHAVLGERYLGIAVFARPRFSFDARTPEVGEVAERHWFWGALLEQGGLYRDVLGAALLVNIFALVMPLFVMNVYDRIVPNNATDTLWMLALGVLLVIGMDFMLRLLRGRFIDLASARIDVKLSALIMERVLGMRLEARPASVGSFAANLRSFESVRDFIASATVSALIDLPFALIFLLVIVWIAWPLVLIPLLGLVVGVIYAYLVQHRMHELAETTYRATAQRNAALIESLTALETIKTQSAEGVVQNKWERTTAFLARSGVQLRLLSSSASNGAAAITQVVNVALVIAGVYLIQERLLTMGGLIAVTMLGSRAIAPLAQAVGLLMQYQNARLALSSLDKMMAAPVERPDATAFIHRPELSGEIEFRHVSFSYPEQGEAALRNVSLHIAPGERVIIIGRTGCGKSTLQKLMLGLYQPSQGVVRIDGIDLRQLDPADLRRNIGCVGQDATLFYGTLRENIAIGAPYADDAAIVTAAEVAGLTQFVNRHPKGFDMLIGERGESLSGGQRQEVAIARAVLLDPPILLLDEPTSAMDFSTEQGFKERLMRFAAHKTVVVVTHRTSLIDLATRLIVVDDGQIVADGPRDQVVEALQSGRVGRAAP